MLNRIHHVGIVVRSADQALAFYRDALGLAVTKEAVLEDQGIRGVLLTAGEGELELLEPVQPETGVARFLESRGEGLHHLCFETDDVEAELERARARGLPLIDQQPRDGLAGRIAFLHPRAARGVLVEFAQPPAGKPHRHGAPQAGAGVRNLDHVAVAVNDLDAGVKTYVDNFGLTESGRGEVPALGIRNAVLPVGDAYVEPIAPLSAEGAVADFLKSRGEGMYLISLSVSHLDAAVTALHDRGLQASSPSEAAAGSRLSFVSPRVTNGVSIQLRERLG